MSIDGHFEKRGVKLSEDNSLPKGERTQKNVKRVIAAVRAAESEFNDELRAANERCRSAQEQVIALQHENQALRTEVLRHKLSSRIEEIDSLTSGDKMKLLEVA